MKSTLKKILCCLLACLSVSLYACGPTSSSTPESNGGGVIVNRPTKVTNKTYQSFWMKQHDYKTMPIAAFAGAAGSYYYPNSLITDEHFKTMSECYINTSFALYDKIDNAQEVIDILKYCAKYGISYLAGGSGFSTANNVNILETQIYRALLDKNNDTSALGGIMIRDEPSRSDFETIATAQDTFKQIFGSKYLYHANLFPTYANTNQLYGPNPPAEGYTYEQHVDDFLEIYNPQVLSYDYYPLHSNDTMSDGYFENMSIIRRKAAEKEIPFWVYIQTAKWSGGVRIPSYADLHWLVNTSLAYGSKGIQYFTYTVPSPMDSGTWSGAIIDKFGEKTEVYAYAQAMNKYITEVDEVLMCCLSKGIMVAGSTPCTIPDADVITSYGALTGVEGESVLVGCFDYNGQNAYYVVNNDVYNQTSVKLTFSKQSSGYNHTYAGKTNFSDVDTLEFTLDAGTATLIVLDK